MEVSIQICSRGRFAYRWVGGLEDPKARLEAVSKTEMLLSEIERRFVDHRARSFVPIRTELKLFQAREVGEESVKVTRVNVSIL
jgi:hypothetical protein